MHSIEERKHYIQEREKKSLGFVVIDANALNFSKMSCRREFLDYWDEKCGGNTAAIMGHLFLAGQFCWFWHFIVVLFSTVTSVQH